MDDLLVTSSSSKLSSKKQLPTSLQRPRSHSGSSHASSSQDAASSVQMFRTGSADVASLPESPLATRSWSASGHGCELPPPSPLALATRRVLGGGGGGGGEGGWGSDAAAQPHPLSIHYTATNPPPVPTIKINDDSDLSSYGSEDEDLEWSPMDGVLSSSTINLHEAHAENDDDSPLLVSKSAVWDSANSSALDLKGTKSAMELWQEKRKAEKTAVQVTTIVNWINDRLKPGKHDRKVVNLFVDLQDGMLLIKLLENLTKKKMTGFKGKQPKSEAHKIDNLDLAFQFMQAENIKMTGIGGLNIYQGDTTLTLGMIWVLIQKYQIRMRGHKVSTKQVMMQWLQALLPKWNITNLTSDWKDGRALLSVINAVKPGIAPSEAALDPTKHRKTCTIAIKVASNYLKIPKIISPEDLSSGAVDEVSVMTYLSYFVEPFQAKLLKSVQKTLPQFNIQDFSSDWYSGRAFWALTAAYFPEFCATLPEFNPESPKEYVEKLLSLLKRRLGIKLPFEAADLVSGKVEELQVMTLVMLIRDGNLVPLPDEVVVRGEGIKEASFYKETSFIIDTSRAGPGKLYIDAFYEEDGEKLKFGLTEKWSRRVFSLTYTPTRTSSIIFNITWSEVHIPGSPFTVPVTDASLVKIINFDAHSRLVEAGKPISLSFEVKKAGMGQLSAYLQYDSSSPGGREKIHAMATTFPNSTIKLDYTPTKSGTAVLHIFWNKEKLKHLAVTYTVVDVGGYSVQSLPKKKVYCIFEEPEFCIHSAKGLPLNVLQMTAVLSLDVQVPIKFTSVDGNTGHASFTPTLPGKYRIEVVCVDQLIRGTPFSLQVSDPHSCKIRGDIPSFLQLGKPHTFEIDTKEAGMMGNITFESSDHDDISTLFETDIRPFDNANGDDFQHLEVKPLVEGDYLVGIKYQGHWISNSPFRLQVCDPAKFRILEKLSMGSVGHPIEFTVRARERLENGVMPLVKATGPTAKYSPQISKSDDGLSLSVRFVPWEVGEHEIVVKYGEFDIPDTPIHLPVVSFDPNECSAAGSGLQRAFTGVPAQFHILGNKQGLIKDGTLRITVESVIDGVQCRIRARDNKNGKYNIAYVVDDPGAYLISIQTAGRHIPGSPFKLNALPGPKASACKMYGPALEEEAILTFGKPIDFTVDTSQGGIGKLEVRAVGPNDTPARVFVAKADHSGIYDISIDAQCPGKHRVSVKWSGHHIPCSPFVIKVFPGADARKCIAHGPGLEDGFVGKKSSFTIETKNAGAGLLKVRLHGIKGAFKIEIAPIDQQNRRTLLANYNPTQPGEYLITIKWSEVNVPGSPFRVKILGNGNNLLDPSSQLIVYTPTPRPSEDFSAFEEIEDEDEEEDVEVKGKEGSNVWHNATKSLQPAPSLLQSNNTQASKHTPIPTTFRNTPMTVSSHSSQDVRRTPRVTFGHAPQKTHTKAVPSSSNRTRKQKLRPSGGNGSSRYNGQVTVRVANPQRKLKHK